MMITLEFRNDLLAALLERSKAANSNPDELINTLLASALGQPAPEVQSVDPEEVVKLALGKVRELPANQEFTLDDVIDQATWHKMSTGDRKSLGKGFRKQAEASGLAKWADRNSSNKAIYIRQS